MKVAWHEVPGNVPQEIRPRGTVRSVALPEVWSNQPNAFYPLNCGNKAQLDAFVS
jgi:hypothetical protein